MEDSMIRLEIDTGVATLTIDRAAKFNAINDTMVIEMIACFERVAADNAVRVVVLAGDGKHFSAGGDMDYIGSLADPDPAIRSATVRNAILDSSLPFARALCAIPQPVIACVRGHAIGIGLQMVILSDLVVASETARFTLPMLELGHTPDHGETWSLPRKIGMARALQMTLLPDRIDAATAEKYGLVNWVAPDGELEARTREIATRIAKGPPIATRTAKQLFRASNGSTLEQSIWREAHAAAVVAAQGDFVEALSAFSERRRPHFKGC